MDVFIKWNVHCIYTPEQYTIPTGNKLKNIIQSREFYKNMEKVIFSNLKFQIVPLSLMNSHFLQKRIGAVKIFKWELQLLCFRS